MCDECHEIGRGSYCSSCGVPFYETIVECPKCETEYRVKVNYCSLCGAPIGETEIERQLREGTFDPSKIMAKIKPEDPEFIKTIFQDMKKETSDFVEIPG